MIIDHSVIPCIRGHIQREREKKRDHLSLQDGKAPLPVRRAAGTVPPARAVVRALAGRPGACLRGLISPPQTPSHHARYHPRCRPGFLLDGMVKCLIKAPHDSRPLLARAIEAFAGHRITVVVGYRAVAVMETYPDLDYVYNPDWRRPTTACRSVSPRRRALLRVVERSRVRT